MKQWWSAVDAERFIERAQCFIDQYSNYTVPEVDMNVIAYLSDTCDYQPPAVWMIIYLSSSVFLCVCLCICVYMYGL